MSASARTKKHSYEPAYAVAPGETLLEKIEELGMSQAQLAMRLGLSEKHVSQIINGKQPITQKTAIGLERVTAIPAHFWNDRESVYRERTARLRDAEKLSHDLGVLPEIPLTELRRRGIVSRTRDKTTQLQEVLAFFGVTNVATLRELWKERKVAARSSRAFKNRPGMTATWLRLGELEAQSSNCNDFEKSKFEKAVGSIRSLTVQPPSTFVEEMTRLCADSGVALALVPEISGAPWYGASWWLTSRKAVIELNLRGKTEDQFWFSFFHEAGHILKGHSKKELFINDGTEGDPREQEANRFAEDVLIPRDRRQEIPRLNKESMISFARGLKISVGIVAGQYQRMTGHYNYRWLHELNRKFQWAAE